MKKMFFVIFTMAIFAIAFTSCDKPKSSTIVEQQIRVIEPEFFYLVKEVVKDGYTTWDRARVHYGSGFMWRDIVAQNKFLQEPGRVWQDKVTGIWYCLIRSGEELIIGTTKVNPVFIENIDAPEKETVVKAGEIISTPLTTWFGWVLFALIVVGFILLLVLLYRNVSVTATTTATANSSPINVHIHHDCGIDLATRATLLGRQQDFDERALAIAEKGEEKNRLQNFSYSRTENGLAIDSEFFPPTVKPATEPALAQPDQKEEGK